MEALGAVLMLVLVAHFAAHVAIVVMLAREARSSRAARAAFAVFFPPVGVFWAWEMRQTKHVVAYGATLAAFAALLVVAAFAR